MDVNFDTTQILLRLQNGDAAKALQLVPVLYDELRQIAGAMMKEERMDHTLQPTALVNEAFLRLIDQRRVDWKGRAHFCAVASKIMRRILIDHARRHTAQKRGGDAVRVPLGESNRVCEPNGVDLLALDQALDELDRLNPRHRQVVELRYFGGLNMEEAAHILGVSRQTAKRDWQMARAWLQQRLTG